jgi:hypothetical protein
MKKRIHKKLFKFPAKILTSVLYELFVVFKFGKSFKQKINFIIIFYFFDYL